MIGRNAREHGNTGTGLPGSPTTNWLGFGDFDFGNEFSTRDDTQRLKVDWTDQVTNDRLRCGTCEELGWATLNVNSVIPRTIAVVMRAGTPD